MTVTPVEARCELCGRGYEVDARRLRVDSRRERKPLYCPSCRMLATIERRVLPPPRLYYGFWLGLPEAELDGLLVAIFGPEAASLEAQSRRQGIRQRLVLEGELATVAA